MNIFRLLLGIVVLLITFTACDPTGDQQVLPDPELTQLNVLFGNPSGATADASVPTNYLISLPQFSLSYNSTRGIPNWVSWYLSEELIGNSERQDNFRAYTALPSDWYVVKPEDYAFQANGFDRGHNCPSADRTRSDEDNSATFYMINMIPQAPEHNQGIWKDLEEYCRKLVFEGNELYIIMGNHGVGGTGLKGYREKLAGGKITVPRHIWRIIVVLPKGEDDLQRVDEQVRVIAVSIENKDSNGNKDWADFRISVNEIEAATGYDFLSALPNDVEAILEAQVDEVLIP